MAQLIPILIVDDEEIIRRMIADVLALAGHTSICANSGEEALALLETQSVRMVITDNNMPGMMGLQLLQTIREKHPTLPVILMTAYGKLDTSIRAHELGADGFLLKPFDDINSILEEVKAVFERRRRQEKHGAKES